MGTMASDRPVMEHSQDTVKKDKYLEGHPLDSKMTIKPYWSTPVAELDLNIPEDMRVSLIKFVASSGYGTTMGTHDGVSTQVFEQNQYNMFSVAKENPIMAEWENICSEMMRYYIARSHNIPNADQINLEARAFGNMQTAGRRTYPHYHHSFDFVMIVYLTLGGEFQLINIGQNNEEVIPYIPPNSEVERMIGSVPQAGNGNGNGNGNGHARPTMGKGDLKHDYSDWDLPCEGSGTFILTDPRPAINYPYNQKALAIKPEVGKAIFHPGYCWHESNTFTGEGIRCAIVVNARILTQNNSEIVLPLPKI